MDDVLKWGFGIDTNPWSINILTSGVFWVLVSLMIVFLLNGGIGWTRGKLFPKAAHRRAVEDFNRYYKR